MGPGAHRASSSVGTKGFFFPAAKRFGGEAAHYHLLLSLRMVECPIWYNLMHGDDWK